MVQATLPHFLARHGANVSFVHIDSDLYSSARTVLRLLAPRLSPGAVVVFDELINYPEFSDGEMRALLEFQWQSGRTLRVLGTPATRVARTAEESQRAIKRHHGEHMGGYCQNAVVQVL